MTIASQGPTTTQIEMSKYTIPSDTIASSRSLVEQCLGHYEFVVKYGVEAGKNLVSFVKLTQYAWQIDMVAESSRHDQQDAREVPQRPSVIIRTEKLL